KDSDPRVGAPRAEKALRRSLERDPNFARTHAKLALALLLQEESPGTPGSTQRVPRGSLPERGSRRLMAQEELSRAHQLDPALPLKHIEAEAAFLQQRFADAEPLYQDALREDPHEVNLALGL